MTMNKLVPKINNEVLLKMKREEYALRPCSIHTHVTCGFQAR